MTDDANEGQSSYPDGVPNFNRWKFLLLPPGGAADVPLVDAQERVMVVAEKLRRPVRYVDDDGYEHEIIAGATNPTGNALAWVEYRCKTKENGHVDVEFRLRGQIDGCLVIDWLVEAYNPFFGCQVRYLAWHQNRVVVIYREKHHTYAASLAAEGDRYLLKIADDWFVTATHIVYAGQQQEMVERLSLPDLTHVEPMGMAEAKRAGIWLSGWGEQDG